MDKKLALTTEDFAVPTRGINLSSFTNVGVQEADFRKIYGNGDYAILTKAQMAELIYASEQYGDIVKGDVAKTEQHLKVVKVLVDLEKGGQSIVFCVQRPDSEKAVEIQKAATDNDIQKSVLGTYDSKIQFKKSGEQIKEKLGEVKKAIDKKVTEVAVKLAALQVKIGSEPTEKANEWWYRNNYQTKVGEYLVYHDSMCYGTPSDTSIYNNGYPNYESTPSANSPDICQMCRQYNSAISSLIDLKCDYAECDTYIENLEDDEKYTLTADQLTKLGF